MLNQTLIIKIALYNLFYVRKAFKSIFFIASCLKSYSFE
jgi:hypothetical protein